MRKTNLTPAQYSATSSDASPLIVRAGAGSGKTRVLVERYLRLVLDQGIPPTRILAATFTEKAAAQMKERVAKELITLGQPELAAELNSAPVCTLHSFCSRLIAPQALAIGLDPSYRIIEEHEARLLQEEILTDLFTHWRNDMPVHLNAIVSQLHWSGDHNLRPGRSPASRGFSRQFLDLVQSVRCAGKVDQLPFAPLEINPRLVSDQVRSSIGQLDKLLWGIEPSRAPKSQVQAFAARRFLENYLKLSNKQGSDALEIIQNVAKLSLRVSDEFKAILKPIREELCPLLRDFCYLNDYDSIREPLNVLFVGFQTNYAARKRQSGLLDFLDLEEFALQILRSPDAHPRPVDFILLDEAQDLNPVQWDIIKILSAHAPLFAVGDAQQSIYGFRDAEVRLFAEMAEEAQQGVGQEILLGENFRSRKSILDIVNRFFEKLWSEASNIPFLELEAEYPYPPTQDCAVELLLTSGENRQTAREAEALLLTRRLVELVQSGTLNIYREKGFDAAGKPILVPEMPDWGDVLILVRSSSSFAPLERAFRTLNVPFVIQAGRGFWDALEVSDLLALLRCLEDPGDDFSLACLLRSPAVGFSDDDLIELRLIETEADAGELHWKTRSLYKGLVSIADSSAPVESLARRAEMFLNLFLKLYHLKDRLPVRELIQTWIEETGLEAIWAQESEGHLVLANVRKFLRLCDAQAGASPARLRAAFEEMRLRDLQESSAAAAASDQGAVRVMTVHSAKGLEAPIVAVFDMNYKPRGSVGAFAYAMDDGAAFSIENPQAGEKPIKPQLFEKIGKAKFERSQTEDQRVLYVAMTRAREKLILSASYSQGEKSVKGLRGWFKLLLENLIPGGDQIFDPAIVPSGVLQVFDRDGVPAPLLLRRSADHLPSVRPEIGKPQIRPALPSEIPIGFPSPPEPGNEPVSVVEFLKSTRQFSFDFQLSFAGDSISDEAGAGGMAMGSWLHRILQVLPLDRDASELDQIARREALAILGYEPELHQIKEAQRLVHNFLHSPLADQVRKSQQVIREFPILFELNGMLLKGKLDLAFEDDSGWTIVDYKSDRQPSDQSLQAYIAQLSLYAQAWSELTGTPPHRALLFFLDSAAAVDVPLPP